METIKNESKQTLIRIPLEKHEHYKQEAKEMGVPLNSFLIMLLDYGDRAYNYNTVELRQSQ